MRKITILSMTAVLAGCAGGEKTPEADSPAMAMGATPITLSDVAGTWNLQAMHATMDSVLIAYTMTGSADPASWTMTLPGGQPIPLRITTDADSMIIDAGPYPSALRPGTQVTTHSVNRLEGGMLVGHFTGRYTGPNVGADTVLHGRLRASRAP